MSKLEFRSLNDYFCYPLGGPYVVDAIIYPQTLLKSPYSKPCASLQPLTLKAALALSCSIFPEPAQLQLITIGDHRDHHPSHHRCLTKHHQHHQASSIIIIIIITVIIIIITIIIMDIITFVFVIATSPLYNLIESQAKTFLSHMPSNRDFRSD